MLLQYAILICPSITLVRKGSKAKKKEIFQGSSPLTQTINARQGKEETRYKAP